MPGTCVVQWSFCGSVMRRFLFCNPSLNKEIVAEISVLNCSSLSVLNIRMTLSSADIGFLHLHAIATQKFDRKWRKQIIVKYSRHDFDYRLYKSNFRI